MLTSKQRTLLMYIHDQIRKNGVSPSFDEMCAAVGLASKSGIHRYLVALEERGFIRRIPNRARAMEIKKLPNDLSLKYPIESLSTTSNAYVELPLYGKIAAGMAIEALRDNGMTAVVPKNLIKGDCYALEVVGDSMKDAGILDGDVVVIRKRDTVENGRIVVALIHDHEVTLKRFIKQEKQIILEAANKDYQNIAYTGNQVQVQGELIGLIRKY